MNFITIFHSIWPQFAGVSHSARFEKQLLRSIVAALALSNVPASAVCDSFETIKADRGDQRFLENDAVRVIETRYKNETDKYDKAFDDFQKRMVLDQAFHYDLSSLEKFLRSQMTGAIDTDARQTAAIFLVALAGYETAIPSSLYRQIWYVVPPDSASWGKEDEAIEYESEGLDPDDAKKFLQDVVKHNLNRQVQARAQTALVKLASRQHDPKAYQLAYAKLEQYKDLKETKIEISFLNPQNRIVPGKAAPVFHLPAIDGSAEITNEKFSGKWYLLDFWATWCGPCLGERAALQEAYSKFKNRNFTVVSISLDETPGKVVSFRKTRWSMPWQHAFLPRGVSSQTAKDYEVDSIGLPRLVLVAPDGKVVAVQHDLSREVINRTLGYYLGSPSGQH
jgi:thiol-disulfide isomerase/thioredoxin